MPINPDDKELQATEALITAALHIWNHDAEEEEIDAFLGGENSLSKEDEAALLRLGGNPLKSNLKPNAIQAVPCLPGQEAVLALHRKRPVGGFSETTDAKINHCREELLQKLKKKKGLPE